MLNYCLRSSPCPSLLLQESALAHVELPTTVETVEAAIKKHKDFTTTMELNLHRIKAVIEAGESLISQSNIYSDRIKERVDTLAKRCAAHRGEWLCVQLWVGNAPLTYNESYAPGPDTDLLHEHRESGG